MKKLSILLLMLSVFTFEVNAQKFAATVTKRGSANVSSVVQIFNAKMLQYVQWTDSTTILGYIDVVNPRQLVNITVSQNPDTIYNRVNKYSAELVKCYVVTPIRNTTRDTSILWYLPISKISDLRSTSVAGRTQINSVAYVEQSGKYTKTFFNESYNTLSNRIDSLLDSKKEITNSVYDTSTYTMKLYDKYIVLNSMTADTLNLLNPSQFANRTPLVVANIGSGAYTIQGGFTVKDKSGSNVTSLTANTVYTFKAYYNGSSYIWLKLY